MAVVPTFNEVGSLAQLADRLLGLDIPTVRVRMLVVDDASTDGTAQVADRLANAEPERVQVLHRASKRGLGSAYVDGFGHALAQGVDLIAQMDADLSHEPSALPSMVEAIRGADLVIGSRYVAGGAFDRHWGWHRKAMSWLANRAVVPAILSLPVSDATSGYRLWRRETLARIAPSVSVRSSGYGFQVEMVFLAHRLGCTIHEVPIHFHEREAGQSKMTVPVALRAGREILAISRQHRPAARVEQP
jgi:dolichol-phosphate mannosyltransferase